MPAKILVVTDLGVSVETPSGAQLKADAVQENLNTHAGLNDAHGSTSENTASRIVSRNADGTFTISGIQLDTDATPESATGLIRWNDTDKCAEVVELDGKVTQVGQELGVYARNESGVSLPNGAAVYVTGSSGQRMTFGLAVASSGNSRKTLGLVTSDSGISNNNFGSVTIFGFVRNIDTSAFSEGDELYLSDSVAGTLTTTPPSAESSYVVRIGWVTMVHASNGAIFVAPHFQGSVTGSAVMNAVSESVARTAIGLGNVDNTSDANKPISTSTQTALDAKAPTSRTISTTAPMTGGGDLSSNRTLGISTATISATGVVQLATSAESITGTDSSKANTPAGARAALTAYVDPQFASRSTLGCIHVATTGAYRTSVTTVALGTENFFLRVMIPQMGAVGTAAPIFATAQSGNERVELRISTARVLSLRFTDNAGATTDYTFTGYALTIGGTHDLLVSADRAGNAVLYDAGTAVSAVAISASASVSLIAGTGGLYGAFVGTYGPTEYGNVALSASDVSALARFGWSALSQYVHRGGAGVGLLTGDNATFDSTVGNWAGVGAATFTQSAGQGVAANVSTAVNSVATPNFNTSGLGSRDIGKVVQWSLDIASLTGGATLRATSSAENTVFGDFNAAGELAVIIPSVNFGGGLRLHSSTGSTIAFTLNGAQVMRMGLCGSWRVEEGGAGYQLRDRSGGGRSALLASAGVDILISGVDLSAQGTLTFSGSGSLQLNGQLILPTIGTWRLVGGEITSSASLTISVGSASSGTQYVSSQAVTATTAPLTLVGGGIIAPTTNVWVTSNGAGTVTVRLRFIRVDTL